MDTPQNGVGLTILAMALEIANRRRRGLALLATGI